MNESLWNEVHCLKMREKGWRYCRSYEILDTSVDKDLDGVVELASQICDSPLAFITSLMRTDYGRRPGRAPMRKKPAANFHFVTCHSRK